MESKQKFFQLPSFYNEYWEKIEKIFDKEIKNFSELDALMLEFQQLSNSKCIMRDLASLHSAIEYMEKIFNDFLFFGEKGIFLAIKNFALEMKEIFKSQENKINLLPQNENGLLILNYQQTRSILAHAFFGTLIPFDRQENKKSIGISSYGELSFYNIFCSKKVEAAERIKCQLYYFYENLKNEKKEGEFTIIRRVLSNESTPNWKESNLSELSEMTFSSVKKIEDSSGLIHIDFANKNLMIHQIIASLTQEEVLFSIKPDLFISLLVCETMSEKEAIFLLGAKKYCLYTGYLETFKFVVPENNITDLEPSIISAIDAYQPKGFLLFDTNNQFQMENFIRDLNKAYIGFGGIDKVLDKIKSKNYEKDKIATGNWGCGAFGGDFYFKFLQQLMAASIAKKKLDYSTFGNENLKNELTEIYNKILKKKLTVGNLFEIIEKFQKEKEMKNFKKFLLKIIE